MSQRLNKILPAWITPPRFHTGKLLQEAEYRAAQRAFVWKVTAVDVHWAPLRWYNYWRYTPTGAAYVNALNSPHSAPAYDLYDSTLFPNGPLGFVSPDGYTFAQLNPPLLYIASGDSAAITGLYSNPLSNRYEGPSHFAHTPVGQDSQELARYFQAGFELSPAEGALWFPEDAYLIDYQPHLAQMIATLPLLQRWETPQREGLVWNEDSVNVAAEMIDPAPMGLPLWRGSSSGFVEDVPAADPAPMMVAVVVAETSPNEELLVEGAELVDSTPTVADAFLNGVPVEIEELVDTTLPTTGALQGGADLSATPLHVGVEQGDTALRLGGSPDLIPVTGPGGTTETEALLAARPDIAKILGSGANAKDAAHGANERGGTALLDEVAQRAHLPADKLTEIQHSPTIIPCRPYSRGFHRIEWEQLYDKAAFQIDYVSTGRCGQVLRCTRYALELFINFL